MTISSGLSRQIWNRKRKSRILPNITMLGELWWVQGMYPRFFFSNVQTHFREGAFSYLVASVREVQKA